MEDGRDRARRPAGRENRRWDDRSGDSLDDILARHGLLEDEADDEPAPAAAGGRAARRRAAEQQEPTGRPPGGRRRAPEPEAPSPPNGRRAAENGTNGSYVNGSHADPDESRSSRRARREAEEQQSGARRIPDPPSTSTRRSRRAADPDDREVGDWGESRTTVSRAAAPQEERRSRRATDLPPWRAEEPDPPAHDPLPPRGANGSPPRRPYEPPLGDARSRRRRAADIAGPGSYPEEAFLPVRDTPPPVRRVRSAESAPDPMTQALPTNGVNGSAAGSRRRAAEPPPTTGERPRVRRGDRESGTHAIPPGERSAQRARRSEAEGGTRATPTEGRPRERRRDRDSGTHAIPPGERSAPRVHRVEPEGATRAIPSGDRQRTRRSDAESGSHAVPPRARRRDAESGAHPVAPGEGAVPRARRSAPDDAGTTRVIPTNGRPRGRRDDPESGSHAVPPRTRRRDGDSGSHPAAPRRRAESGAHVVPPGERSASRARRVEPAEGDSGARRIPAGERSGSRTRKTPLDPPKPVPDGVRAAAFGEGAGKRARGAVEADSTQAIPQGGRPPMRPPRSAPAPVDDDYEDYDDDPEFGAGVTRALPTGPPRRPPRDERGLDEFAPSGLPERQRRGDPIDPRAARIDETLTRLTAAHAGMAIARDDEPDDEAPKPAKRSRFTPGRVLGLGVAVLVFGTTALGFTSKTMLDSAVRDVTAIDKKAASIVDAPAQVDDENVLIMATSGNAQPSTSDHAASSVAVAHFPAGGGEVRVISLPWNLEINRPPCRPFNPQTGTYGDQPVQIEANTKLSEAYDKGGPACTAQVVQQLTGLAITSFVGMDLEKMKAAVDAVGGVEVCVPHPVRDTALGPILPNAGDQTVDSKRASDLMRAVDVEGDPASGSGIIERQQKVLAGVLESTVSTTGLLSVRRVSALRTALSGALMADESDLDQMLALSRTLSRLDADGVAYLPLPTNSQQNGRGNLELRPTEASAIFAAIRTDAPLPEGATGAGSSGAALAPKDLSIRVFNASDRSGLAGTVGETLKGLGFGVSDVKNADKPTQKTVIKFSPDKQAAAELLAASVPSAETVPDPGTTGVLDLVLGRSYDDSLNAPVEQTPTQDDPAATGGAACG